MSSESVHIILSRGCGVNWRNPHSSFVMNCCDYTFWGFLSSHISPAKHRCPLSFDSKYTEPKTVNNRSVDLGWDELNLFEHNYLVLALRISSSTQLPVALALTRSLGTTGPGRQTGKQTKNRSKFFPETIAQSCQHVHTDRANLSNDSSTPTKQDVNDRRTALRLV
jgi:hypothetical protein